MGIHVEWMLDGPNVSPGTIFDVLKYGGLVFRNVTIPRGAVIVSAKLRCCADWDCPATWCRWILHGEAVGNAVQFSTLEQYLTRPLTEASVDTDFLPGWVAGEWYELPGLEAIIQEIVSRPEWAVGNALAILFQGHPKASTTHEIRSYETDPTQAAELVITYGGVAQHALSVGSNPITGVPIMLNGQPQGVTPQDLILDEGTHIIEVPEEVNL